MLTNIIVLAIAVVAAYFVVKEEKRNFRDWLYKDKSSERVALIRTIEFWKAYISKPVRILCLVVVLICQKGVVSMMISIVILLMLSYALTKWGVIDGINWADAKTQKIATGVAIALATLWVINGFGLLKFVYSIVMLIGIAAVILAVVFLLITRKK